MAGLTVADIPHMLKMWDRERNTESPETVSVHCMELKYWKCPDCGYEWTVYPRSRYKSSGKCPCHELKKAVCRGINDVLTIVKGLDTFLDKNNNFEEIYNQGINSSLPVNFKCNEYGRKWIAQLNSQIKKDSNGEYIVVGCPHYNTVKRKSTDVPFCSEVDSIIRFWDDKNPIDPTKTKSSSTEKAHFICKNCGYDWTSEIRAQIRGTGKCKCCELQLVTRKGINDVFTLIPESKSFFDFNKNKDIDIYSISPRNTKILIDWKCPVCSKEWRSPLSRRVKGKKGEYSFKGSIKCSGHSKERITPVASVPELIKFWDFKKNKGIDPNLTSSNADIPVNWRCKKCSYEWVVNIRSQTNRKGKCPFCDGIHKPIMKNENDVLSLCPDFEKIYDFEQNAKKGINIYKKGVYSKTEAHFKCPKCGNEWDSLIADRIKKLDDGTYKLVDCPVCSNDNFRKIPYSVEFPLLAKMYRTDLNDIPLDSIRGVNGITNTYYHWECPDCKETFESTLNAMKESHKTATKGCPYCSRTKLLKERSFAKQHPELMDEYDPDNTIDPYNVFPNDKNPVGWICRDCAYHWDATFALRHAGGGKCPLCNRTILIPEKNSFAAVYPDYVKYWADSNERKADEIFSDSAEYHFWHCFVCDMDYRALITNIVSSDNSCPYCDGRRAVPGKTSLKALCPNIAALLSPNDGHDPDLIVPTACTPYIWKCPECNYDYNAPVYDMINGYTCPYCNNRQLKSNFNSFAVKHPDLLDEMYEIANYLLPKSPYDVFDTSDYKFWWICTNDPKHIYPMSPRTRLMFQKRGRQPCLYCRGYRRKLKHFVLFDKNLQKNRSR